LPRTISLSRILLVLLVIAAAAVALGVAGWHWIGAEIDIGWPGIIAMTLGILGTLVVGGGLMALVFYSARSGHDEQVQGDPRRRFYAPEDEDP
jgi:hypothetical protein